MGLSRRIEGHNAKTWLVGEASTFLYLLNIGLSHSAVYGQLDDKHKWTNQVRYNTDQLSPMNHQGLVHWKYRIRKCIIKVLYIKKFTVLECPIKDWYIMNWVLTFATRSELKQGLDDMNAFELGYTMSFASLQSVVWRIFCRKVNCSLHESWTSAKETVETEMMGYKIEWSEAVVETVKKQQSSEYKTLRKSR